LSCAGNSVASQGSMVYNMVSQHHGVILDLLDVTNNVAVSFGDEARSMSDMATSFMPGTIVVAIATLIVAGNKGYGRAISSSSTRLPARVARHAPACIAGARVRVVGVCPAGRASVGAANVGAGVAGSARGGASWRDGAWITVGAHLGSLRGVSSSEAISAGVWACVILAGCTGRARGGTLP